MIRRLRLENWRAYETLDLELGTGTTFIVAPNGVGKTSLLEAAAWALFGEDAPHGPDAVRAGADFATATVVLALPDGRELEVARTRRTAATKRPPEPADRIDGQAVPAAALADTLTGAFGARPSVLARVVMPTAGGDAASVGVEGLTDHLCQMFGVAGLNDALADLDARLKETERAIRDVKQGRVVSESKVAELKAAADEADQAARIADAAHQSAREELAAAQDAARARRARDDWERRRDDRDAAFADASARLAALLDANVAPDGLADRLDRETTRIRERLDAVTRSQGENDGRTAALASAQAELYGAHEDCPICRRPLDERTIDFARSAHEQDLAALAAQADGLARERAALTASLSAVGDLAAAVARAPQPGPEPQAAPAGPTAAVRDGDELMELEMAKAAEAAAVERLVEARTAQADRRRIVHAASLESSAHDMLVALFAREAVLRAARAAVQHAVTTFMNETVAPLSAQLGPRWSALFPGRGPATFNGGGGVTRSVNGHDLPLGSFSGGERTGALVVLRLLVAQMTTRASFCWFDEPLEHLDPDTRRQVASMLSGAGDSYPLRQVVVTTYEEPLAARMAADDPDRVGIVSVRAAP
ncbi:MAG: AAA family ATPase [Actinobacteria bacterium]|uniref:Unannotated protein n=1 Tax=freshwater metagenome TaxID=449393 RepID=A0A6J7GUS8_9ZZZZ|nr:AAA family ATPase [Actinomycetota bacterium]